MGLPSNLPDVDRQETEVLDIETNTKRFQPDGEGYNLYFPKEESDKFNIDKETPVEEAFVVRNGRVEWLGNAKLNAGFSKDELREHAENREWEVTDEYEGSRWSYSFKEPDLGTIISIDKPSIIDGKPVNNVFVKSREIALNEDLRKYDLLKAVAREKNVEVTIRDSEGLWQRLKKTSRLEAPDLEVLSQIVKKADVVEAHLNFECPSIWLTLEELDALVETINEAIEALPEES